MSKRRLYAVAAGLGVTASVALALLFGIFQAGSGAVRDVDPGVSGSSVDAEAANEVASASDGEYGEGIKVHGRWTIEVLDPDGMLVEHREFDNALTSYGARQIAKILGGLSTIGHWQIELNDSSGGAPPCTPGSCVLSTFTVSAPASGPNDGKLVFSGSVTAGNDGQINVVYNSSVTCAPTFAPSTDCVGASLSMGVVTTTNVSPAVSVLAGQQILVTVVIGFS